jgi:hypothetical protein
MVITTEIPIQFVMDLHKQPQNFRLLPHLQNSSVTNNLLLDKEIPLDDADKNNILVSDSISVLSPPNRLDNRMDKHPIS